MLVVLTLRVSMDMTTLMETTTIMSTIMSMTMSIVMSTNMRIAKALQKHRMSITKGNIIMAMESLVVISIRSWLKMVDQRFLKSEAIRCLRQKLIPHTMVSISIHIKMESAVDITIVMKVMTTATTISMKKRSMRTRIPSA